MSTIDWSKGTITPPANAEPDWDHGTITPPPPPTSIARRVGDVGVSLAKGIVGVPEAAVGVADLATGGRVGKVLEQGFGGIGFRPKEAKAYLDTLYSPAQQAASKTVQDAKGFFPTVGAMVRNPSTILQSAVESAPSSRRRRC